MAERLFSADARGVRQAVTDVSAGALLPFNPTFPNVAQSIRFVNIGTNPCHIALGVGAVPIATVPSASPVSNCLTVLPGSDVVFSRAPNNATHFAAVCAATLSTTLDVFVSDGL